MQNFVSGLNINMTLFRALDTALKSPKFKELTKEQQFVGTLLMHDFHEHGIHLPAATQHASQKKLADLLQLGFQYNEEVDALRKVSLSRQALECVPRSWFSNASLDKNGKFQISTTSAHLRSATAGAPSAEARKELYVASWICFEPALATLTEMLHLRQKLATTLSVPDYASISCGRNMTGTPENARKFLCGLLDGLKEDAQKDFLLLRKLKKEIGGKESDKLFEWDVGFLSRAYTLA
eukprot:TRINITY_DN3820_c0_g1_i1.p2 TRINITY_DN3820_c0_g1~~TRINITY_DN3820_c0_g1_i1.p2  ORF type:complete len:238 (-),score=69.67 TRINITY_DN3820_c0_g1_i1:1012-1725(-)